MHLKTILPLVEHELELWRRYAEEMPDAALRKQALASITAKRFHCEGGALFAAWEPQSAHAIVRFIVALQTISDYLDNLCDRTDSLNERDFRRLHLSMLDAVSTTPRAGGAYYRHHPHADDGGYLDALVRTCRAVTKRIANYRQVESEVQRLVSLYVDLQVYKHLPLSERVPHLEEWFAGHNDRYPALFWWEFAAAAGSTLAVFALITEAARRRPVEDPRALVDAYFPWICGLHILLDYFIDQDEDCREGDLNFVSFYRGRDEVRTRMGWMLDRALTSAAGLTDAPFHRTVIEGLLGLYLSDPKVKAQDIGSLARSLVRRAGWRARVVHLYCGFWRVQRRRTGIVLPANPRRGGEENRL